MSSSARAGWCKQWAERNSEIEQQMSGQRSYLAVNAMVTCEFGRTDARWKSEFGKVFVEVVDVGVVVDVLV